MQHGRPADCADGRGFDAHQSVGALTTCSYYKSVAQIFEFKLHYMLTVGTTMGIVVCHDGRNKSLADVLNLSRLADEWSQVTPKRPPKQLQ